MNESVQSKTAGALSNVRGAVAIAHWDVPDCGNSEFFISLKEVRRRCFRSCFRSCFVFDVCSQNKHLDAAYGGYAVFATVADEESFVTVDKIAAAIAKKDPAVLKIDAVELK